MHRSLLRSVAAVLALATATACIGAEDTPARPVFQPDGTVQVPAFGLPASALASKEAQQAQKRRAQRPGGGMPTTVGDIAVVRKGLEAMLAPQVAATRKQYPVDVVDQMIAGVPTRIVTPKDKAVDRKHVLINLHGGGFSMCADGCALIESMPIAALGGYKVVTVNYRMAPEANHPASVGRRRGGLS